MKDIMRTHIRRLTEDLSGCVTLYCMLCGGVSVFCTYVLSLIDLSCVSLTPKIIGIINSPANRK